MLSLSLGPLALPVAPVVLLLSMWAASWLAGRLAARADARSSPPAGTSGSGPGAAAVAGHAVLEATLLGLVAARLAYLGRNADLYAAAPASVLDVRDGGWQAVAGVVAGAAWLAWRGWRTPALRRPLAASGAAGLALWWAASLALRPAGAETLPPMAFARLDATSSVTLSQAARGRPVVVNLWASWCGPCRQEMPLLAAAQQRDPAVAFVFVNQGEPGGAVTAYLAGRGLPLQDVLLDPGSTLGPAIGSRGLPTTLFYDTRGRLVDAHFGVLDAAGLESRLRALRASR